MKMVRLGEVLSPHVDRTRVEDPTSVALISVRLHGKGAVQRKVSEGKAPKPFVGNRARAGQFVLSRIWARRGAMAIIPPELDGVVVTNEFPIFEIDTSCVNASFFARAVQSPGFLAQLQSLSAGASGQNRIREARFLGLSLPLPSLEEQQRIAAILDEADEARTKRKKLLAALNALPCSVFTESFGHPMDAVNVTRRAHLGSLAAIVTGNSPSRRDAANFGDGMEWIKSGNLGGVVASAAEERLSSVGQSKSRIAPSGSVLVTCIAGSVNSIGKASLVDRRVAFNQQINAVLPSDKLNNRFLLWQLKTAPELVRAKSTGGMKGLVSKSAFSSIDVLVPPLPLQQEFADKVAAIDVQRRLVEAALEKDDELFASLQSRAFSGRL